MLTALLLALAIQNTPEGVLFQCETNGARVVYLAGDFNEWARNNGGRITNTSFAMAQSNSVWSKTVALEPGTYHFKFNFNGEPTGWFAPDSVTERDADGNAIFRVRSNGTLEFCGPRPPRHTPSGVVFEFCAPNAHIVYLAGDFNDWAKNRDGLVFDPRFAMSQSNGIWRSVGPLPSRRHEYRFVIDGDHWTGREVLEVK